VKAGETGYRVAPAVANKAPSMLSSQRAYTYLLGPELMNETITPLMKEGEAVLKRMAGGLSKSTRLKVSIVLRDGTPFEEICRTAKKLNADLIALTTRGHTGVKRVWLGSTAERTVRHAPCPVLVVGSPSRTRL